MAEWRIQLLGEFRLHDGSGREIPVRSPKVRALIAYLALHPDQPVKRETLAALLWGDSPDVQARPRDAPKRPGQYIAPADSSKKRHENANFLHFQPRLTLD